MGWRDYIGALREQEQIIQAQQGTIEQLEQHLKQQQRRSEQLEAELRAQKKLKGKPKLSASQLNEVPKEKQGEGKRAGSAKRSKKFGFEIDVEIVIQPEEIPENARVQWVSCI